MMKYSADKMIRKVYPEIKSGMKKSAVKANAANESKISQASLKPIELGWVAREKRYSPKWAQREKRDMVTEEIRMFEEEQRKSQCCYSGQTMCLDKME